MQQIPRYILIHHGTQYGPVILLDFEKKTFLGLGWTKLSSNAKLLKRRYVQIYEMFLPLQIEKISFHVGGPSCRQTKLEIVINLCELQMLLFPCLNGSLLHAINF